MTMGHFNQWTKVLALCAVSACALAGTGLSPARAQAQQTFALDLPAAPLDEALLSLGNALGVNILATQNQLAGKTAPALKGTVSAQEAINRLLEGSGLAAEPNAAGDFIVTKAKTKRTARAQTRALLKAETIIVTGTKQYLSLQDTQTSVSIITGAEAEEQAIFNIEDVALRVPNVSTSGGSPNSISIRGISFSGVGGAGSGVTANIYVDGTPSSTTAAFGAFNLWDIGQVEVLRGPQSTIQGRNALAGAIIIQSADPEYEFAANARVIIGNENNRQYASALTGPIIEDQLAFRVSADYREVDFGVINQNTGRSTRLQDGLTLRGKLLVEPDFIPDLRLELIGEYSEIDSGDFNRVFPPVRPSDPAFADFDPFGDESFALLDNFSDINTTRFIADADYKLDDNWSVKLLGTYETVDRDRQLVPLGNELFEDRTYTSELRASFDYESVSGWIGGYFFDNSQTEDDRQSISPELPLPFPLDPPNSVVTSVTNSGVDTRNYAIFGNATFDVTDRLTIDLGARYDWEQFESSGINGSATSDPPDCSIPVFVPTFGGLPCTVLTQIATDPPSATSFEAFLPRGSIIYDFDEFRSVSFTVARGYRAGGVFQRNTPTAITLETFDPEFLTNYELAVRTEWPNLGLIFNANIFYSDWQDQQVNIPGLSGGPLDFVVVNAGSSELYGAEFSAQLELTDKFQIFGNMGLLWTEFTDFPFAVDDNGDPVNMADPQFANLAGDRFNSAPRFNAAFGISYDDPDGLFGNLNASYSSGQESGVPNLAVNFTDSLFLVNARAGYRLGNFELAVFANNLFDERTVLLQGLFSVSAGTGVIAEQPNPALFVNNPRLWGVEARLSF